MLPSCFPSLPGTRTSFPRCSFLRTNSSRIPLEGGRKEAEKASKLPRNTNPPKHLAPSPGHRAGGQHSSPPRQREREEPAERRCPGGEPSSQEGETAPSFSARKTKNFGRSVQKATGTSCWGRQRACPAPHRPPQRSRTSGGGWHRAGPPARQLPASRCCPGRELSAEPSRGRSSRATERARSRRPGPSRDPGARPSPGGIPVPGAARPRPLLLPAPGSRPGSLAAPSLNRWSRRRRTHLSAMAPAAAPAPPGSARTGQGVKPEPAPRPARTPGRSPGPSAGGCGTQPGRAGVRRGGAGPAGRGEPLAAAQGAPRPGPARLGPWVPGPRVWGAGWCQ